MYFGKIDDCGNSRGTGSFPAYWASNAVTSSRLDSHFVMEIKVQDLHKSFGKENIMDEKIPSLLAAAAATRLSRVAHYVTDLNG